MSCMRRIGLGAVVMLSGVLPAFAGGTVSTINDAQMQALIAEGVKVVDVRRADEWRSTGIVPGTALITAYDRQGQLNPRFLADMQAVVATDKPVVLICRSGNRSLRAAELLASEGGYQTVFSVDGGIKGWIATGAPVLPCPNC